MGMKILDQFKKWVYYSPNRHYAGPGLDTPPLSVRIMVIRHKDGVLPACFDRHDIYTPLNCGDGNFLSDRADSLADNVGENISEYNPFLNEMTGVWWVSRHYSEIGNPDYIGFNHYRRYLEWKPSILRPDVVVATATLNRKPIRSFFVDWKGPVIKDFFTRAFVETFPEDEYRDFESYLDSHVFHRCNLFIMGRSSFMRYASFMDRNISKTIQMIREKVLQIGDEGPWQKRIYGLYLEQMTSYWLFHESKTLGRIKVKNAFVQDV